MLSDHIITDSIYNDLKAEDYKKFIFERAEEIKKLFDRIGVVFKSVNKDDVNVEENDSDEEDDE